MRTSWYRFQEVRTLLSSARTHRHRGVSICAIPPVLLGLAIVSLVLVGTAFGAGQDPEAIPIFVFTAEAGSDDAVEDVNLPAREREQEPMWFGPEGNEYHFDLGEARRQVELLNRQLQQTGSRRDMMELVESQDQAVIFLQVVATEVSGSIQGDGIFGGGSSVTTSALQEVLVARMTIRNSAFTSDFLGTKVDGLRTPSFNVAAQIQEFVERNLDTLRGADPRR